MTQPINVSRWQNKIRAMTGIDGENPVPTLAELVPIIAVEQDRVEWGYAGNEFRYMHVQLVAAGGAGTNSVYAVLNPKASGVLATLEGFAGSPTNYAIGSLIEATILASYTVSPVTELPRDTRLFGGARAALTLWSRNNAAAPTESYRMQLGAAVFPPLVLSPGFAFLFWNVTQNSPFEAAVHWRERPQESGKPS